MNLKWIFFYFGKVDFDEPEVYGFFYLADFRIPNSDLLTFQKKYLWELHTEYFTKQGSNTKTFYFHQA